MRIDGGSSHHTFFERNAKTVKLRGLFENPGSLSHDLRSDSIAR
jgi:hypothetical protein